MTGKDFYCVELQAVSRGDWIQLKLVMWPPSSLTSVYYLFIDQRLAQSHLKAALVTTIAYRCCTPPNPEYMACPSFFIDQEYECRAISWRPASDALAKPIRGYFVGKFEQLCVPAANTKISRSRAPEETIPGWAWLVSRHSDSQIQDPWTALWV